MKKIYLAVFLAFSMGGAANAQISEGGLPWSMNKEPLHTQVISKITLPTPDYEKYAEEDLRDAITGAAKPYRVAATVPTNITLDQGTWYYLDNGDKIWRAKIEVPGAQALSIKYDEFFLPEGVKLFVSNENQRHILGAFTSENNSPYNVFAHEEVQGPISLLEIDVPAHVNIADIKFKVGEVYGFYRGVDNIQHYAFADNVIPARPTFNNSPPCHVNANCDQGWDEPYVTAKNATVRISSGGGWCTGTLINTAANLDGPCKLYLLTASHCDGANRRDNAHFATWTFRFNYQFPYCDSPRVLPYGEYTLMGANFLARSNNPSFAEPDNALVMDFMLLELTDPIPAMWDFPVNLVGWNRREDLAEDLDYNFYIGFHHPSGDVKKLSSARYIEATGRFNQRTVNNTHWAIGYTRGGTSPGSSGSGLFDKNGLLIGDLSGGTGGSCEGGDFGINALYSKLSYAWENAFDQRNFPEYAGRQSRLKDWLDPNDVAIVEFPSTKYDCSDLVVSVKELDDQLSRSVSLYPNPSSGTVNIRLNFTKANDVSLNVYDITGAKKADFHINKAFSGNYSMDLNALPNGIYMVHIQSGGASTSQKIVLSR